MSNGRPAEPNTFFAKVLADQQYQRARDLEQQGYWEQALLGYRRACDLDPSNPLFLLARGRTCQQHAFEREAEQCYELVLRLRPNDVVALYNQAQLLASRGQLDQAQANLARIIEGGTSALGERAAPIFARLAEIALRRGDWPAAEGHLRHALGAAPQDTYSRALLAGLERFAEFGAPFQQDGRIAPKIALYGYAGAMVLGMPADDGITIPPSPPLGFESLEEVSLALARFRDVVRHYRWPFACITALEPESQPLAVALAEACGVTAVSSPEQVPWGADALGVSATGADLSRWRDQCRILHERAALAPIYAVGLAHPAWEYDPLPHVVTLPVRLEFPWNRSEAAAPEHAEAFGVELAGMLASAPADATLPEQVRWYERHPHLTIRSLVAGQRDAGTAVSFASARPASALG